MVVFGGANSRDNSIQIADNQASFIKNVIPLPSGSAASRNGFACIQKDGADDTPGSIPDPETQVIPADALIHLPRIVDEKAYLICVRNGKIWQHDIGAGTAWLDGEFPLAGTDLCAATGRYYDGVSFYGASAFCVTGRDEPFLITGEGSGDWWTATGTALTEMTGATVGNPVVIKRTAHGLADGDIIRFSGVTETNWSSLNNRSFRIEKIDADRFYLLDPDLDRIVTTGGTWVTVASPVGTIKTGILGVKRWPHLKYAIDSTRQYGYPSRWDNPTDTGDPWGTGNVPDWPSGIAIFGQGLLMQAFAWGFLTDPDRIDVSMLGEPAHFGNADVDAANEAASVAEPGIDGGYFYCQRGDGDRVTGVLPMFTHKVVFKTRTTTVWSGDFGSTDNPLHQVGVFTNGNANSKSYGVVGGEVFFWDPVHGPKVLRAVQEYGDIAPSDLGEAIPVEVKRVTQAYIDRIRFVHDRVNRRVMWFAPVDGSSTNNFVFVYYYLTKQWTFFDGAYSQCSDAVSTSSAASEGECLYASRLNGQIVRLDQGFTDGLDYAGDPVPVASQYNTKWFMWPGLSWAARLLFADVVCGNAGLGDAKIEVAFDFSTAFNVQAEPEASLGAPTAGYDHGLYDSGGLYDQASQSMIRMNLDGSGNLYQIRVSANSIRPWQIHMMGLEIAARGKRT
jgi:hypothetical protein